MIDREIMLQAEKGNADCMYDLGMFYYSEKYFGFAYYWINRSAKLGNVCAMFALGTFLRNGVGVKINRKLGYKWLIKAAKAKNAQAMTLLVSDYFDGLYKSSDRKTLGLCKRVACLDSGMGEYYLGLCYYKGTGVQKNIEKARYHFTMSAINGFEFAKYQLSDKIFNVVV